MAHEAHGRCWAAHGPFGLTFSNDFVPSDALSLRFPTLLDPLTLSPYACAAKSPKAELSWTSTPWYFEGFWAVAGNLEGGDIRTFLLIPDTCHL